MVTDPSALSLDFNASAIKVDTNTEQWNPEVIVFDSGGDLGGLDPTNSLDGPAINKLYIERGFDGLQCADDFKMNELSQWLIGGLVVDLVKTNIQSSTPEEKCKILAVSLEKVGYSVTECYNAPSGGLTNKICFNYNATTKQQNDKKVFLETYSSENGYQSWCKNKVGGGVWDRERIVATGLGGHLVPYNGGNLEEKVFDGAGLNTGRNWYSTGIGKDDMICVAAKKLDSNEWELASSEVCDFGTTRLKPDCSDLVADLNLKSGCNPTYVYSRQIDKSTFGKDDFLFNIAIKKGCR